MNTKEFLQYFPGFCIQTFDDLDIKLYPGTSKDESLITCRKPSNYTKDEIKSLNDRGAGIYFTPNKFPKGKRGEEYCEGVNAWYVESDDLSIDEQWANLKSSPLAPSFVVQSKNSLHAYWLAKDGTKENFKRVVKGLVKHFQGDSACAEISRVLRVPGFYHKKDRNNPFLIGVVEEHPECAYTESEMIASFPYEEEKPKSLIVQKIINTDDFWQMMGKLDNKSVLIRLSGQSIVNGEIIEFKKRRPAGEYIYVNGGMCDAWLDEQGMIGSGKRGGPTWIQWLGFYNIPKSEIARWAKDNLAEVKKWTEEHEPKKELIKNQIEKIEQPIKKKTSKIRYTWGTQELDDSFGIIKPGNFIVAAAKRNSGKTTFAFDMACKNAKLGRKVLFLSLEMDTEDIIENIGRKYSGITIPEERDYKIPEVKQLAFDRKVLEIKNMENLFLKGLRSTENILWETILTTIQSYQDLDLIFLDNLDLIGSEPKEFELDRQKRIVKNILSFTYSQNIPLILIHHYRKSSFQGKEKGMDEMSGSGKIADGADMVIKISRNSDPEATYPERYQTTLYLQKCRGYQESIKSIYFIKGTFVDIPSEENNLDSIAKSFGGELLPEF